MSKPHPDELLAIAPAALVQVTGGASSDTSTLMTQVTGILDSIKSIRNVSQDNGINPQEMMLFMMLMNQRNQQPTTVQVTPWWTQSGSWY